MRDWWTWRRAAAIAAGAVAGATTRWAVVTWWGSSGFPWAVLAVNVAGSLLLGVLVTGTWTDERLHLLAHDAGGIGFCGALTTFSTFAVDVVELARDGDVVTAGGYAAASVVAAVAAFALGAALRTHERRPVIEAEP